MAGLEQDFPLKYEYTYRNMAMNRFFPFFSLNMFDLGPLHNLSRYSDFGFEFAEIFVIPNQLPRYQRHEESPTPRIGKSMSRLLNFSKKTLCTGDIGSRCSKLIFIWLDFKKTKLWVQSQFGKKARDKMNYHYFCFFLKV